MSQEAAESGLEDVLPAGYAARGGALLDYAGLVSAIAAADVLAGETTERRRCVPSGTTAVYKC